MSMKLCYTTENFVFAQKNYILELIPYLSVTDILKDVLIHRNWKWILRTTKKQQLLTPYQAHI